MLETRADYDAAAPEAQTLTLAGAIGEDGAAAPVRLPPKVAHVWVHAHETPEHEYFWGAWLSVVVSGEEWGYRPTGDGVAAKSATGKK